MKENNKRKSLEIYWSILMTSPSQTNPKSLILSHLFSVSVSVFL